MTFTLCVFASLR